MKAAHIYTSISSHARHGQSLSCVISSINYAVLLLSNPKIQRLSWENRIKAKKFNMRQHARNKEGFQNVYNTFSTLHFDRVQVCLPLKELSFVASGK